MGEFRGSCDLIFIDIGSAVTYDFLKVIYEKASHGAVLVYQNPTWAKKAWEAAQSEFVVEDFEYKQEPKYSARDWWAQSAWRKYPYGLSAHWKIAHFKKKWDEHETPKES